MPGKIQRQKGRGESERPICKICMRDLKRSYENVKLGNRHVPKPYGWHCDDYQNRSFGDLNYHHYEIYDNEIEAAVPQAISLDARIQKLEENVGLFLAELNALKLNFKKFSGDKI